MNLIKAWRLYKAAPAVGAIRSAAQQLRENTGQTLTGDYGRGFYDGVEASASLLESWADAIDGGVFRPDKPRERKS